MSGEGRWPDSSPGLLTVMQRRRQAQSDQHEQLPRDTQYIVERLYTELTDRIKFAHDCETNEEIASQLTAMRESQQMLHIPGFAEPSDYKQYMRENTDDIWQWLIEMTRFTAADVLDYLTYQARRYQIHTEAYADFCKLAVLTAFEVLLVRYNLFDPCEWRRERITQIQERHNG